MTSDQNDPTIQAREKRFRGWRLLAVIMSVVIVLALVSFLVDWIVIGPLEGRAF
ncbi:MAG: DUF3094 family protein [Pseudomonadales bacterium]